jgi:DNA-binding CsgD family transcriptional regulator
MPLDPSDRLCMARAVELGESHSPLVSDSGVPAERIPARLTRQETECLCWCKEGKTNWEIGEVLLISEKTVEFYLGHAMRKLGAANRITAVIRGIKRGFIVL